MVVICFFFVILSSQAPDAEQQRSKDQNTHDHKSIPQNKYLRGDRRHRRAARQHFTDMLEDLSSPQCA